MKSIVKEHDKTEINSWWILLIVNCTNVNEQQQQRYIHVSKVHISDLDQCWIGFSLVGAIVPDQK